MDDPHLQTHPKRLLLQLNMHLFYNLFVYFYLFMIRINALFNTKAHQWVSGRRKIFTQLKKTIPQDEKLLWFHCASLGEFEQGRPVIESIRNRYPDHKILLTFFSPSGYEIRKNYSGADYVFYMPIDTKKNARKFIRITRPRMAFFVKYEFWFNYIHELSKNKIALIYFSVSFRKSQHFFKPWGKWARRQLQKVTYFFVQDQKSIDLLSGIKVYHAEVSGDTRFDRVAGLVEEKKEVEAIARFKGNSPLMVAGSTWPADEDILLTLMEKPKLSLKLVVAPHEIHRGNILNLMKKFERFNPVLFSKAKKNGLQTAGVLIIDNIGLLSYLYRYATLAYIGGGFGVGIHNILEAATYGKPVIFGPNYQKFNEAVELLKLEGAFVVHNAENLLQTVDELLNNKEKYSHASGVAGEYVISNAGASQMVIDKASEYLNSY